MKPILSLAAAAAIAISAPALAQEAGAPGATGASGSLTGSNTPGSGVSPQWTYGNGPQWNNGGPGYGGGPQWTYGGPGYDQENPGYAAPFFGPGPGLIEGRAAAEDYPSPPLNDFADPTPRTVRGDQNGQDLAR